MKKIILLLVLLPFISSAQIIQTFAGNGLAGYMGDGGPATAARLSGPVGVATDAAGNIFISDYGNNVIRKVTPAGIISTVAGNGIAGYSGDGGPATNAHLYRPIKISLDTFGNLYIADMGNHVIRKVTSGIISTIAGTGVGGFNSDGIAATAAQLFYPSDVITDRSGNVYISDYSNYRIRKVSSAGIISTYAGTGVPGGLGDGGPATAAQLWFVWKMALDAGGNLYLAAASNDAIRKITPGGIISTIAGTGTRAFGGDGGMATTADLSNPAGVAFDASGNMYIADDFNYRIRKVVPSGIISTIAGNGTAGYAGDGGAATAAELNEPNDVLVDGYGRILVADPNNNRIRLISACTPLITNHPSNDTVVLGSTAKYWVRTSMPSPAYQWQQNAGTGYVSLVSAWPYSGVNTDTLTILSATLPLDTTRYRCVITNAGYCTDTSMPGILYITTSLNVAMQDRDGINIFPNPAMDKIDIAVPSEIKGSLQLINSTGSTVVEQKIEGVHFSIDLKELPASVYMLRLQTPDMVIYKKVVKIN
jgi:hypothetical protein